MTRPTAIVYVDGFNLYKGTVERNPQWKWLDIERFAQDILSDYEVTRVHYFTAPVRARANPRDPRAPDRQHAFLRALEGTGVVVHKNSTFSMKEGSARLRVGDRNDDLGWVDVWKIQEKGTDVKLALQLVMDALDDAANSYWLVTSDSDLAPAVALARERFGAHVGIIYPRGETTREFNQMELPNIHVHPRHLAANQLPSPALTKKGSHVHRPPTWTKQ